MICLVYLKGDLYWLILSLILCIQKVITARIRRMGEGNIFTLCVNPHLDGGGGGVPHPANRGVPHPADGGGILSWQGGMTSQVWRGYPIQGLDWGEGYSL